MSNIGNKEIMAKNLKNYLKIKGKNRTEICSDLGLPYSTFTEWLNGKKYPRIDNIEKLANYFGIEKSDLIEDKTSINNNIGKAIKYLRTQNNKSMQEMSSELGIDQMTLEKYEKGLMRIPHNTLKKIAEYLNTSIDELISFNVNNNKATFITNDKLLNKRYNQWQNQIGYNTEFTDEEINLLIKCATFIKKARNLDDYNSKMKMVDMMLDQLTK